MAVTLEGGSESARVRFVFIGRFWGKFYVEHVHRMPVSVLGVLNIGAVEDILRLAA